MQNKPCLKTQLAALALAFTAVVPSLQADLILPTTDVSDGALNITNSGTTVIDLSRAVTVNNWTNSDTGTNGVYDPNQWAVVFKYSSVYIASNATVTFINHLTHAPVVWLVNGNVTINGNLNLDGQAGNSDPNNLSEPGPGGFRGGGVASLGYGTGFGPGGVYADAGNYSGSYGNPQIIPLIGGSGGAGGNGGNNGSGGGGAILIAATGTLNLTNGNLHAIGGGGNNATAGSGGAIRLVANQISGNGGTYIQAVGGSATFSTHAGGAGIIRLEARSVSGSPMNISPTAQAAAPDSPVVKIFPATNEPTVLVYSVAGITNGLADPKAAMSSGLNADDVTLVTTNAVTIQLQTRNFPTNGTVTVYIKPRNAPQTTLAASYLNGNTNAAFWQVSTTLLYPAHTVIQAHATF